MDYLSFENREEDVPALMVLALSLGRSAPKARLHLPAQRMGKAALAWFSDCPNVVLHRDLWPEDAFWNVKPFLLEQMLERGCGRVTWLDADIVVTADPAGLFDLPEGVIAVAQEGFRSHNRGTAARTLAIGRRVGRELGYTVNSCIVSVTARHKPLLADWRGVLRSELYHDPDRSPLLVGDQDVLGGLLGADAFAELPVRALRSGREIAHDMLPGDFTLAQRLATLWRGEPVFAHAQGRKTWRMAGTRAARGWRNQLAMHRQTARALRGALPAGSTAWLEDDRAMSRLMQRAFPSRPSLRGLALGALGSGLVTAYRARNLLRPQPVYRIGQIADDPRGIAKAAVPPS